MRCTPLTLFLMACVCACSTPQSPDLSAGDEAAQREQPEPSHRDEQEHEALPKLIKLSEAVIRDARIQTTPVVRRPLPTTLALPGEIAAEPDKSAQLASPIPGRVEQVHFQEGSQVERGAVLATIRVPDLDKLRSEQAAARAKAAAARTNAERLKALLDQHLTAEQTYRDALASAQALEGEAHAADERLRALGLTRGPDTHSVLTLRAPISGVVLMRNAVVGQPVNADQVLCEIADLSEVWFLGRVFEKDLGHLEVHAPAEVQLNAYNDERFVGTIEYIGRRVDPVARTVTARIRLENRDDLLRVGLFGTAYVSTKDGSRNAMLVVPRSALTEVGGKPVVFVQHPDGDFEVHELVLGASALGLVEVISGLREGERVVHEGVFTLKSAVLKSTFAEEE